MNLKRYLTPIVLLFVVLAQFFPVAGMTPKPAAAASYCDWAQFVADVTIPDGTSMAAGTAFVKTWRLKNIGTCTWSTSYALVFNSGELMGATASVPMPSSVPPGGEVNLTVNMTAPAAAGHYRGYWQLRNASSVLFGIGAGANSPFWVDIYVTSSLATGYDFAANYCAAAWSSGAGALPCPGTDGSANGFVLKQDAPKLETGATDTAPGLLVAPQNVAGGFIRAVYPAFAVQSGDRFQSIVNCAYGASSCYVRFRLDYQIGAGPVLTLWSFKERSDGLYYRVDLNLSSLAGQNVAFILYVADVSGYGVPSGDRALWGAPKIVRGGGGTPPPPPTPPPSPTTCDRAEFNADVTIPDGTSLTANTPFTKTWRLKNVGTCTWTTAYTLYFVSGDLLGAPGSVNLPSTVAPGQMVNVNVPMVAPPAAGHYRGYWKLRNASSVSFGIGSSYNNPFWVDIYATSGPTPGFTTSTTTILSDAPDPSTPGQPFAVNVSVSGGGPTPTGSVVIAGADTNCVITLAGGSGSCPAVFNTVGAKTLTATYTGDLTYAISSDTENHTVSQGSSTTTISSDSPDPSVAGGTVTVSVTVSGAGATPAGSVTITGADAPCTITLGGGSGSCPVVFSATGAKTLTATYGGDSNYTGSSDTESHTVSAALAVSVTTITGDVPDSSTPGQTVVVGVTVSGTGATPTGTVTISGADTNCPTITLVAGSGTCNVVFNTTGAKTLKATYSGDTNYATSLDTESHTVNQGTSTTTIVTELPDPSTPGQPVAVSVTVIGAGVTPTGTVTISGADTNCTITLVSGSGSCNVVFNTTGIKSITATYNGDMNYVGSSATAAHTVIPGPSTTTITADLPDPSAAGGTITITVIVGGAGATPTGTVTITFVGAGAPAAFSIPLIGGSGSAPSGIFTAIGTFTITATYSGDPNYLVSSDTETHTVN